MNMCPVLQKVTKQKKAFFGKDDFNCTFFAQKGQFMNVIYGTKWDHQTKAITKIEFEYI